MTAAPTIGFWPGEGAAAGAASQVRCCIAGCGPAGAMLGLLLARAGVDVVVLEKHADFLRDFRGDTIHPSTLEMLDELGLAERSCSCRTPRCRRLAAHVGRRRASPTSVRALPTRYPFIALRCRSGTSSTSSPTEARALSGLPPGAARPRSSSLLARGRAWSAASATDARTASASSAALLTVGADGRDSRDAGGSPGCRCVATSPPMDVLWFRVSRRPDEPAAVVMRVGPGHVAILIDRDAYWQIAYTIRRAATGCGPPGSTPCRRAAPPRARASAGRTAWRAPATRIGLAVAR